MNKIPKIVTLIFGTIVSLIILFFMLTSPSVSPPFYIFLAIWIIIMLTLVWK